MTTATQTQPPAFTLTADQQAALTAFVGFLADPAETVFVLAGYSGCGKSTLLKILLNRWPSIMKTVKLINPDQKDYVIELTATTNKAAENLSSITGQPAGTIHSYLGLRVQTDYSTGVTTLVSKRTDTVEGVLLFIDEASLVDQHLLTTIFRRTRNCKIVFVGDPAQLAQVKASGTPVFDAKFNGAHLSQVVRQAEGNPIVDLSTKFRHAVNTGEFFRFQPDGNHVIRLGRDAFNEAIKQEFTRPDWKYSDSKVLAWTNKCVIAYNHFIRNFVKGDPHFQAGDYAVCNSYLQIGKTAIKTDTLVQINSISADITRLDVLGNDFHLDCMPTAVFMPKTREAMAARLRKAKIDDDIRTVMIIESAWIDLRAAYACTVNKAQGSTYDDVFIDLDDIRRCNSGDQIARMLYVAVSRARNRVYLTGDLA